MSDVTVSLASIAAEAMALVDDLEGLTPCAHTDCIERARRLRLAAERCHRTLAAVSTGCGTPIRQSSRPVGRHVLSCREMQVLRLLASGFRDREVAEALLLSPRTVTSHVTAILNKLGVASRTGAVAHAIRDGLV